VITCGNVACESRGPIKKTELFLWSRVHFKSECEFSLNLDNEESSSKGSVPIFKRFQEINL